MDSLPSRKEQQEVDTIASERSDFAFVDSADDTPENRAIVDIVEERRRRSRGPDRDLDDVIGEFGLEPADFLQH
jgi:hypothetical protein